MMTTLAVDCMGGDHGVSVTLPAIAAFLRKDRESVVISVGLADAFEPAMPSLLKEFGDRLRVQFASEVVGISEIGRAHV